MEKNARGTNTTVYSAKPVTEWTIEEVAEWARDVLKLDEKSASILIERALNGKRLLNYGSKGEDILLSDFENALPKPVLRELWAEIEKLKSLATPDQLRVREDFFQAQLSRARQRELSEPISRYIASKVGASFPFVGREELLNSLRKEIQEDYQIHLRVIEEMRKNSETRFRDKLISFKFCYGAPGIGKTRSLYELMQSIITSNPIPQIKKWHTIFIPFTNAFSIIHYDKLWPADTMFAARMIKSELFGGRKSLGDYCLELHQGGTYPLVNLQLAIELISKEYDLDNECGILLIIDEINKCFERELPSDYVKCLLTGLAKVKSADLPYILPIFSGTSYVGFSSEVKAANFTLKEFPLDLLSEANVVAMVENLIPAYCESAAFMQVLRDCGGLPRFIQFACEKAIEYHQDHKDIPMEEWDWPYFQDTCIDEIHSTYHIIASEALIDCLLGMQIERQNFVGNQTWGQLEMSGAVVIVNKVPVVPYLALLNFVRKTPDHYLTRLSVWPMVKAPTGIEKCFVWQDWEHFNMEFAVMKLKLLFAQNSESAIALNLFLPHTVKCHAAVTQVIDSRFIVKCDPIYIESQHQIGPNNKLFKLALGEEITFPITGQSIKNGVGAGILVLEIITDSDKKPQLLLLLYSLKWTEATTNDEIPLDLDTINEEVDNMKTCYNYLDARKFYIICTGKPCHVANCDLPEDTIVICNQTFAAYFGPTFKSRAVFASVSPRQNPNTMNPHELLGVGPASAKKIIEHRKRTPFKDVTDVLPFTPKRYHRSIAPQLKFDDEK